jgi:exosortase K
MERRFPHRAARLSTLLCWVLCLSAAAALKIHYRHADSDGLLWILGPTSWLVETLLGIPLEYEPGAGYWGYEMGILIAPGCAGVNFLLIAFASVVFPCTAAFRRSILKGAALATAAAGAYLTTLWANAFRIVVAAWLYAGGLSVGWMTPERIHRLEGVLVFVAALWLFSSTVRRCLACLGRPAGADRNRVGAGGLRAPLAWYVLGVVVVPLANPFRPGIDPAFFEHCATVFGGCAMAASAAWAAARIGPRGRRTRSEGEGMPCDL